MSAGGGDERDGAGQGEGSNRPGTAPLRCKASAVNAPELLACLGELHQNRRASSASSLACFLLLLWIDRVHVAIRHSPAACLTAPFPPSSARVPLSALCCCSHDHAARIPWKLPAVPQTPPPDNKAVRA